MFGMRYWPRPCCTGILPVEVGAETQGDLGEAYAETLLRTPVRDEALVQYAILVFGASSLWHRSSGKSQGQYPSPIQQPNTVRIRFARMLYLKCLIQASLTYALTRVAET